MTGGEENSSLSGDVTAVTHQAEVISPAGHQFSLKWNNYITTFCQVLGGLRDKDKYSDVTLSCDGRFYQVHKLVLAICSDYFEAVLDHTPCKHPVIVLKDIKSADLELLLNYMYLGEVSVNQADLERLLKAAESLRIKGLTLQDSSPQEMVNINTSSLSRTESKPQIFATTSNGNVMTFVTPSPQDLQNQHNTFRPARIMSGPPTKRRRKDDHGATSTNASNIETTVIDATVTVDEATNTLVYQEANNVSVGDSNQFESKHHLKDVQGHSLLQVVDDSIKQDKLEDGTRAGSTVVHLASGGGKNAPTISYVVTADQDGILHAQPHDPRFPAIAPHVANTNSTSSSVGQSQPLEEAVAEALAGPSGMQTWLSTSELSSSAFTTVDSYTNTTTNSSDNSLKHATHLGPGGGGVASLNTSTNTTSSKNGPPSTLLSNNSITIAPGTIVATTNDCTSSLLSSLTEGGTAVAVALPLSSVGGVSQHRKRLATSMMAGSTVTALSGRALSSQNLVCPHCNRSTFRQSSDLKRHIRIHTGEKPFQCLQCSYRAGRKDLVLVHCQKIHKMDSETAKKSYTSDGNGKADKNDDDKWEWD